MEVVVGLLGREQLQRSGFSEAELIDPEVFGDEL